MTKLDSIFKSRDITLPTKVRLVKAMVFPALHLCPVLSPHLDTWFISGSSQVCARLSAKMGSSEGARGWVTSYSEVTPSV